MRTAAEWAKINLGDGTRLLLGHRSDDRGLDARPVELAEDLAAEMRDVCQMSLASLAGRSVRRYSNLGGLDGDDFLSLEIKPIAQDDGATPSSEQGAKPSVDLEESLSAADIVGLSLNAFSDEEFLDRDQLFGGGWLFYAVVVEVRDSDNPIAFVRQYNPQRGFDPGRLLSVYGDTLKKLNDPVFLFDNRFDVIVASDEVAVLQVTAFQRVFADVGVVASEVPADVGALETELNVPVEEASRTMLTASCQDRHRLAARLKKLARQPHLKLVTRESLRAAMEAHSLDADRFGSGPAIVLGSMDDVRVFLDVLEKRYYEADFTGEHMRADNASVRAS
jgi:hypothetical protein